MDREPIRNIIGLFLVLVLLATSFGCEVPAVKATRQTSAPVPITSNTTQPIAAVTPTPIPSPQAPEIPVQGPYDIWITDNVCIPSLLIVVGGSRVNWISKDGQTHTVTSDEGLFDEILLPGEAFHHDFLDKGNHHYFCKIHGEYGNVILY